MWPTCNPYRSLDHEARRIRGQERFSLSRDTRVRLAGRSPLWSRLPTEITKKTHHPTPRAHGLALHGTPICTISSTSLKSADLFYLFFLFIIFVLFLGGPVFRTRYRGIGEDDSLETLLMRGYRGLIVFYKVSRIRSRTPIRSLFV